MVPVNIIFSKSSHDEDDHLVTTGVYLPALHYQIFPVYISKDIRIQLWFFAAASLRSEKAKLLKERPALITGSRFYPQGNPRHHRHHCHHRHHLDHLDHRHLKEEVVLRLQPIICSDTSSHACFFCVTFFPYFLSICWKFCFGRRENTHYIVPVPDVKPLIVKRGKYKFYDSQPDAPRPQGSI